ncbi:MAG TPA: universal stress protein [Puia sp.]|nr:universal stress protein [Puia sp.]
MRTLVVPVDGASNSLDAANYAADMALAIDADLHLLHVVRIVVTPEPVVAGYVVEDMVKAGKTMLDKLSGELRDRTHGQVTIEALLEIGNVDFQITEVCRRLQPFAVIMGAPEGSFTRVLYGSPALDAARRLPYPVLVIPPGATFRRIRKVVLACEAKEIAGEMPVTARFLKELKDLFGCGFDIIHVGSGDERKESKQVFELYRWQRALATVDPQLHFVSDKSVPQAVEKYLSDHDADWLMVFPQEHGLLEFHKSRSKTLLLHCTVPVMSICEEAFALQHPSPTHV